MARVTKKTSIARRDRIVAATKELHEACHDCWDSNDEFALGIAWDVISEMSQKTMGDGKEIEGWSGGCLSQYDAIHSVMDLLETYNADGYASVNPRQK